MDNEQVKKYLESLLNKNYIFRGEDCIGSTPAKCVGHEKEINFAIEALNKLNRINEIINLSMPIGTGEYQMKYQMIKQVMDNGEL